jgi:hypothetical protein
MSLPKRLFSWLGGGSFASDQEIEEDKNRSATGWIVLVLTLLFGFFVTLGLIGHFSTLPVSLEGSQGQKENSEIELSLLNDTESIADTSLTASTLPSDTGLRSLNQSGEVNGFSTNSFLRSNALWLGILMGFLLSTIFLLILRSLFSASEFYSYFQQFLWWCAGARIEFLKQSPSDHPKYFGIGGTVMFTALMASFAGGYAFNTAFDNLLLSILFGAFWGALIFNLDRYIVSSTGKGDGTAKITWEEFWTALPRLVLAILIALVVSVPLELKIFEKEINIEVQKIIDEKRKELARGQDYNLQEIQLIKNEIARLKSEEEQLKGTVTEDPRIDISNAEIESLNEEVGTLQRRLQPIKRKINDYDQTIDDINRRLNSEELSDAERRNLEGTRRLQETRKRREERDRDRLQNRLNSRLAEIKSQKDNIQEVQAGNADRYGTVLAENQHKKERLEQQLANIQEMRRGEIQRYEEIAKQYTGLMAKLDALDRLSVRTVREVKAVPTSRSLDSSSSDNSENLSLNSSPLEQDSPGIAALSAGQEEQVFREYKEKTPIFYAKWLITLLFICIEIAPILFKMMTEAGPYDDLLEEEMKKSNSQLINAISRYNMDINTKLEVKARKNQTKLDTEIKANKELLDFITESQNQIAKVAVEAWRDEQMERVKANPHNYFKTKENSNGKPDAHD